MNLCKHKWKVVGRHENNDLQWCEHCGRLWNGYAASMPRPADATGFEESTFQSVVESALYTDENMFGNIRFDAQRELFKRLKLLFPEPSGSLKHTRKAGPNGTS